MTHSTRDVLSSCNSACYKYGVILFAALYIFFQHNLTAADDFSQLKQ